MHKRPPQQVRVKKNDKWRALLTDCLPYELPLRVSSVGLYEALQRNKNNLGDLIPELKNALQRDRATRPLKFFVQKTQNQTRQLSLMHPCAQIRAAEVYEEYGEVLLALCRRSEWTLRAPTAVASYFVEAHGAYAPLAGSQRPDEITSVERDSRVRTGSSYFAYAPFTMLRRFEESDALHTLESRFPYLRKMDISGCFPSMYTHSVEWAIKGKAHAKRHLRRSSASHVGKVLDRLMMTANDNETNGILVGPEVSRVFAEIILQRVDIEVERELSTLQLTQDYAVRRWVDDYFIFARDQTVADQVERVLSDQLLEYNLRFNSAKSRSMQRPFIARGDILKSKASRFISKSISEMFDATGEGSSASTGAESDRPWSGSMRVRRRPNRRLKASYLIRELKSIVVDSEVGYEGIATAVLSTARYRVRSLRKACRRIRDQQVGLHQDDALAESLCNLIAVLFFVARMSPRVRETYLLTEITVDAAAIASGLGYAARARFTQTLKLECIETVAVACERSEVGSVQIANLLCIMELLGPEHRLNPAQLTNLLAQRLPGFDYFISMALLSYAGDSADYTLVRSSILAELSRRILEDRDWVASTELLMWFLDTVTCPYVDAKAKRELVAKSLTRLDYSSQRASQSAAEMVRRIEREAWFFDWTKDIDARMLLRRKDLRTTY